MIVHDRTRLIGQLTLAFLGSPRAKKYIVAFPEEMPMLIEAKDAHG